MAVMTPNEYVLSVVSRYRLLTGPQSQAYSVAQQIYPVIKKWADGYLLEVSFSGSYAKGTGIKGSTDVDLFISLDPNTPDTLKQIYDGLYSFLDKQGLAPRAQNVSIRVTYQALIVDLVPGRKQAGNTNDHSLFKNRTQTWTQTNIQTHIDLIQKSGRLNEIKAIKIWRNLHQLDFPSFLLELTVLDALHGEDKDQPSTNLLTVLEYLRDTFPDSRLLDPANSGNVVSDDISTSEKARIASAARESRTKSNWNQIIW
jgi:hypothetical protein